MIQIGHRSFLYIKPALYPPDAMSLRFFGWSSRGNFIVSMNGQPLGLTTVQDFGNYSEFGVNIDAFAGQNAELRFTQPAGLNDYGIFVLDQISFSPIGVPEPSTWALVAFGGTLFWYVSRHRKK